MAAMTGVIPKTGDVVRILPNAARAFVDGGIERFRILHADPIPDRPGWCRIRGWDLDADPQEYVGHDVLVAGLIIRPGENWQSSSVMTGVDRSTGRRPHDRPGLARQALTDTTNRPAHRRDAGGGAVP